MDLGRPTLQRSAAAAAAVVVAAVVVAETTLVVATAAAAVAKGVRIALVVARHPPVVSWRTVAIELRAVLVGPPPKKKPVGLPLFLAGAMIRAQVEWPPPWTRDRRAESNQIARDETLRCTDRRLVHSKCRPKTPETVSAYAFPNIQICRRGESSGVAHSLTQCVLIKDVTYRDVIELYREEASVPTCDFAE
jgi:hypothetical protein